MKRGRTGIGVLLIWGRKKNGEELEGCVEELKEKEIKGVFNSK